MISERAGHAETLEQETRSPPEVILWWLLISPGTAYRRARPVFLAGVFTDFFEDFLAAVFPAGDFLAAVFFGALFDGALFVDRCATAFFAGFAVFFGGVFFSALVMEVTAASTADLTEPATSSAIASPYPTFSAAFATIVLSAILNLLSS